MVNSEELVGTTEYLTLKTRFRINRCRLNRVRLYLCVRACVYIYIHTYIHTYIYIHIRTYIHTYNSYFVLCMFRPRLNIVRKHFLFC